MTAQRSLKPRLRVFAGPNGSGKSTISRQIERENEIWLGIKVNPDDIEAKVRESRILDFGEFDIEVDNAALNNFLAKSELLRKAGLLRKASLLRVRNNRVSFRRVAINSYFAAVFADLIREQLLPTAKSFSFETVMSHSSKIDFLARARSAGYRVYLYFITTRSE